MPHTIIIHTAVDPGFGGHGWWVGAGGGTPPTLARGFGERCKLPHRGLGRSPRSFTVHSLHALVAGQFM